MDGWMFVPWWWTYEFVLKPTLLRLPIRFENERTTIVILSLLSTALITVIIKFTTSDSTSMWRNRECWMCQVSPFMTFETCSGVRMGYEMNVLCIKVEKLWPQYPQLYFMVSNKSLISNCSIIKFAPCIKKVEKDFFNKFMNVYLYTHSHIFNLY